MRAHSVARRYAQATFDVAREADAAQEWLAQLEAVAATTSDPTLAETLRSPGLALEAKSEAVERAFPELPPELKNLLRLLIARGRVDILPGICAAFGEYVDEMLGRTEAHVTSARPLSQSDLNAIQEHLNARTGRTVKLRTAVDETILGGVVMRVGDELIDASVATRLERLRQRLT